MDNVIQLDLKNSENYAFKKLKVTLFSSNKEIRVDVETLTNHRVFSMNITKNEFEKAGIKIKSIKDTSDFIDVLQQIFKHYAVGSLNTVLDIKEDSQGMFVIGFAICNKALVAANELYPSKMEKFVTTWHKQLEEEEK